MGHRVLLSLASNYQQEEHLQQARLALLQMLVGAGFSQAIWTEPEGAHCLDRKYLNQLAWAETQLSAEELAQQLKELELRLGRTPDMRRQGLVPIDLDLLQHNSRRFHLRDWERSYVRRLLVEVPDCEE